MALTALTDACKETLQHLTSWRTDRQYAGLRGRGTRKRARLSRWVRAVEQVYEYYKKHAPEKARIMDRMFGLTHPVPSCRKSRGRMLTLSMDFNVSESTLYKMREEFVWTTLLAAVQLGALEPFSFGD